MGKLLQERRTGQGGDKSVIYDATLPIHGETAFDKVQSYVSDKRYCPATQTRRGRPGGFRFTINGEDCDVWLKQQGKEFYQKIGINIEPRQNKGNKYSVGN